ncbi:MAG: tyrosine-type recombinase/integrase [Verrucomicrobiota bacterium]|jgi:integrase
MKVRKLDRRKNGRNRIEWVLDRYEGAKRIRKWFLSKAEAEAAGDELKQQHKHAGKSWLELTPEERNDLMLVFADAKRENVTLRQVWEAYKTGKLDAAPAQRRTLKQAVEETILAKTAENLRERYVGELENYLGKFAAGRQEMFIDRVTVADVEQWFDLRGEALSTRKSNLGRLSAMFDVCWRRGYVKENICLKITPPKLDEKIPAILTVEQAKQLLRECRKSHRRLVAWLTLGMFTGIRPEEVEKLKWSDVDLKQKRVRVDAAASKVRRRRTVPLNLTACAWLKTCRQGKPDDPITPETTTLRRHRRALRDATGIEWVQDILRHTAASYLLQQHQDAPLVAHWLGNSARILESKYKNIVTPQECKQFWALTPQAVQKAKRP